MLLPDRTRSSIRGKYLSLKTWAKRIIWGWHSPMRAISW